MINFFSKIYSFNETINGFDNVNYEIINIKDSNYPSSLNPISNILEQPINNQFYDSALGKLKSFINDNSNEIEKKQKELKELNMQVIKKRKKGTIDAIFILRQLQEKYLDKKRCLFYCFVDLENASDRVPRKVIEFALRKKGVEEKLVQVVMRLYEGTRARVKINSEVSEPFGVKVGVHQGSVLSLLPLVTVMDVLSEGVEDDVLFELLYADDLVIMAESMQELDGKYT